MDTFSNKYISSFDILKKSIIGFEFEFYTDRSFYRLLELLNRELAPIKIHGRRTYHSDFVPDEYNFKIEPDLSGGANLVELISGPMPYVNAKIILLKILRILQDNARTGDRCSLHINISFDDEKCEKNVTEVNKLKMILEIDENLIYKFFPNRKNNFYSQSIKRLIPFKGYQYSVDAINLTLSNSLQLPDTKYYGVNLIEADNGRLEFRYIGGKDYQFKTREIMELIDYFINLSWVCINDDLTEDNKNELKKYLEENINIFKNFSKLESFVAEFPTIQLEVDKNSDFLVVKSQYSQMQDKLYDAIRNIRELSNCIVNYDSNENRIEIVDASFETIFTLKNVNIINSSITGGEYIRTDFHDDEIKNAHLTNCNLEKTNLFNCKLENCEVNQSCELKECYFSGGKMDGVMVSGVLRGGVVGQNGELGKGVEVVTDLDSYFGSFNDEKEKGGKKIIDKKLTAKGKI
jgi:uncharacterized protein YjbI with pentapeptide repeats